MSSLSRTSGRLSRGPGKAPDSVKKVHFAEPAPPEHKRTPSNSLLILEEAGREVLERSSEASVVDTLVGHSGHGGHELGVDRCEFRPHHSNQGVTSERTNKLKPRSDLPPNQMSLSGSQSLSFSISEIDRLLARKEQATLVLQCAIRCALARRKMGKRRFKRDVHGQAAIVIQKNTRVMLAKGELELRRLIKMDEDMQHAEAEMYNQGLALMEKAKQDELSALQDQEQQDIVQRAKEEMEREILLRVATESYIEHENAKHKQEFEARLEQEVVNLVKSDPELASCVLQAAIHGMTTRFEVGAMVKQQDLERLSAISQLQGGLRGHTARRNIRQMHREEEIQLLEARMAERKHQEQQLNRKGLADSTFSPSLHLEDLERTQKQQEQPSTTEPECSTSCGMKESLGPFCPERLKQHVPDHNSTIATVEQDPVVAAAKAEFKKLDRNGDGIISRAEMAGSVAASRAHIDTAAESAVSTFHENAKLKNENRQLRRQLEAASRHAWSELQSKWAIEKRASELWNTCSDMAAMELHSPAISSDQRSAGSRTAPHPELPSYEEVVQQLIEEKRAREAVEQALLVKEARLRQVQTERSDERDRMQAQIDYLQRVINQARVEEDYHQTHGA